MKKLFTLAFALLCMVSAFAADVDIIIKTNSEKIEALIQEVSDTEIRYKKASNPNGPIFVIKMDDVSSILYSNGEVQAVEHKTQEPQLQQPAQNAGYNFNTPNPYEVNNGPMQRIGYDEFVIEGRRLKGRELRYFLRENCPVAYTYNKTWLNCEIAGWCLLAAGTGIFVGLGVVFFSMSSWTIDRDYHITGISCMTVGGAIMAGSIPMITCGNLYRKRTHMVFNANCGKPQAFQPELKLTSGANGLGLALSF